jgi:hypothetical protein
MKTLKGWITTSCLVATLMLSTMNANAGVIIGGVTSEPCTDTTSKVGKIDYGVIIGGLVGVIIGGFANTGVIIGGLVDETPTTNCGVIIGG